MLTLVAQASAQIEIKRSRFLATVTPYADFERTLGQLRRRHAKANHHCTAARWLQANGQLAESAKDDGEPGGTAGRPMLRVLQGGDWVDVGVVVVRYFGGIKLGTGGLARAYAEAASSALHAAHGIPFEPATEATFTVSFAAGDRLERALASAGVEVLNREYSQSGVTLRVKGPATRIERLRLAQSE
ncbi:MAG: YigZ family protein [Pseudomonadota bacterium]